MDVVGGRQALVFDGHSWLQSTFPAPRSLSANGGYTAAVWAWNPEIDQEEGLLAWSRRGGPDSSAATLGFGSHPRWGAMAHWGWSDSAYGNRLPPAAQWTHIAAVFDGTYVTLFVDGEPISELRTTLFLHPDAPIVIGAGPGGHAPFRGAISSVRLYDQALEPEAIRELAAETPALNIGLQLEARNLPYGPIDRVANRGSLGGTFRVRGPAAEIQDVAGKIALRLREDSRLALELPAGSQPGEARGTLIAQLATEPHRAWQQLAWTVEGDQVGYYLDGHPVTREQLPLQRTPGGALAAGTAQGLYAVAFLLQLDRVLTAQELQAWHAATAGRALPPGPLDFDTAPVALTPDSVWMTAPRATAEGEDVQ